LRDARSFDPRRGSARSWVYAIVRNTALKRLRKHGHEYTLDSDALMAIQDAELSTDVERVTDYTALRTCLDALEPQRRASLILAFIDGRTHAEIADYLGVPIGTVKSWIRRELVNLREHLR
jgi:RNA polymerase sigma-70 factor (ECF subfamily)